MRKAAGFALLVGPITLAVFTATQPRWMETTAFVGLGVLTAIGWVGLAVSTQLDRHREMLFGETLAGLQDVTEAHTVVAKFAGELSGIVVVAIGALGLENPTLAGELLQRSEDAIAVFSEHYPGVPLAVKP